MTRDEVIRMAREAGIEFDPQWGTCYTGNTQIERFAALVAAAEREACARETWPTEVKVWSDNEMFTMTMAFNRAQQNNGWSETIMAVGASILKMKAAAIRARGEVR